MNQNKKSYIGVTIGPIYKTIQLAKRTGELWGSSYMFSYMMKNIIRKILKEYEQEKIKDRFIVPYIGQGYDDEVFKDKHSAGLFHDRFIFQSKQNEFEKVNKIIEDVKREFSDKVYEEIYNYYESKKDLNNKKVDEEEYRFIKKIREAFKRRDIESNIKKYIKEYFQIYSVECEINENSNENIIFEVSKYLDAVELNEKFINSEEDNYLSYFLKNEIIKRSFLSEDAFSSADKFKNYPSLANIAMRDLGITEEDNSQEDELRSLYKDKRRKVHNYAAIIQVDGDNVGKIVSNLKQNGNKESESFKGFSKELYEHAKNSVGIIKNYGGLTLYAGGDDLLFIAPVINRLSENDCKNIFDLMDNLSNEFENRFKEYAKDNVKPTLSFGVSIIHYKYPLYEALKDTSSLLFNDSKSYKYFLKNEKVNNKTLLEKNAISFKVIKHSGQYYGLTLNKKSDSYEKFRSILKKEINILNIENGKEEGLLNNLRSISNRILQEEIILNCIGNNQHKLENYFKNNFNEDYHDKEEVKECIKDISDLIYCIYSEYELRIGNEEIDNQYKEINKKFKEKKVINEVYSYLKFIRFLGEKEKNDE